MLTYSINFGKKMQMEHLLLRKIGVKIEGKQFLGNDIYKIEKLTELPENYTWSDKIVYQYEFDGKSYIFYGNGRVNEGGKMNNSKDVVISL
ncbi:MAG: hypothetical protein LBP53_05075 [Candidatus Peribacteria bacterium]|jgi:hypothetical protein|nr:hypothetical protein [Candidatus Peribacteria bacterium]